MHMMSGAWANARSEHALCFAHEAKVHGRKQDQGHAFKDGRAEPKTNPPPLPQLPTCTHLLQQQQSSFAQSRACSWPSGPLPLPLPLL